MAGAKVRFHPELPPSSTVEILHLLLFHLHLCPILRLFMLVLYGSPLAPFDQYWLKEKRKN